MPTMKGRARPGAVLKALRQRNKWTLAEVSQRTGVPTSTLSRLENDQLSPTFNQLVMISEGLDIDLASLFATLKSGTESSGAGRRSVNRPGEGDTLEFGKVTMRYLSTDMLNKEFAPVEVVVTAETIEDAGGFMRHAGDEFLYILEGELDLYTEHYTPLTLKAGHSVYFDSSMAHTYVARNGPCRCLSICTVNRPHGDRSLVSHHGIEALELWKARIAATDAADERKEMPIQG